MKRTSTLLLLIAVMAVPLWAETKDDSPVMRLPDAPSPRVLSEQPYAATGTAKVIQPATKEAAVPRPIEQVERIELIEPTAKAVEKPAKVLPHKRLSVVGIDLTEFPELLLVISARDRQGRPITDLDPKDLKITEDEAPQPITSLAPCVPEVRPGPPLSLMLLIDSSGSMQRQIDIVQAAASRFVERLQKEDNAGVVAFCDQPIVLSALTSNQRRLQKSIYQLNPRGFTALYDSIMTGLRMLDDAPGHKAMVLLTDGRDDDGTGKPLSRRGLGDVMTLARAEKIPIYVIGLGNDISQPELQTMANHTGGEFLHSPTGEDLQKLYDQIAERLGRGDKGYYKLTYHATNDRRDSTERTIIIKHRDAIDIARYPAPGRLTWPLSRWFD